MTIKQKLRYNPFFRWLFFSMGKYASQKNKIRRILPHLNPSDRIIDIGSGSGNLCALLQEKHFSVTPLDVRSESYVDNQEPIIYDGNNIPFSNDTFDTSLLIFVLHHTHNPEDVIKEAMRVSKKIIILEDVCNNKIGRYFMILIDQIYNLKFVGEPHSNKTDLEWKKLFKSLGLNLKAVSHERRYCFYHSLYVLEKQHNS